MPTFAGTGATWCVSLPDTQETRFFDSSTGSWTTSFVSSSDIVLYVDETEVDFSVYDLRLLQLRGSYESAFSLSFMENGKHYSGSFTPGQTVELRVDHTTRFYGWIIDEPRKGAPGESVTYRAFGTRYRANEVTVLNDQSVPKVVFNAEPEDDDYDSTLSDMTAGEIIRWIFDQMGDALREKGFSGTVDGSNLDGMTVKPARLAITSQGIDQALLMILSQQPGYKHRVDPHSRVWHFDDVRNLSSRTLTYNDDDIGTPTPSRGLNGVATAVKIVGSEQLVDESLQLNDGELEEYWTSSLESTWTREKAYSDDIRYKILDYTGLSGTVVTITINDTIHTLTEGVAWDAAIDNETTAQSLASALDALTGVTSEEKSLGSGVYAAVVSAEFGYDTSLGTTTADASAMTIDYREGRGYDEVGRRYLISDEDKRRIAKTMTDGTCLRLYYKKDVRNNTWIPVRAKYEWNDGVILADYPLLGTGADPMEEGGFVAAEDVKFVYSYKTTPLTARAPTTGYEGTAYTVGGFEYEQTIYVPEFRSAAQQSDFDGLAAQMLDGVKDLRWSGSIPILGTMLFDWFFMGRTINITSKDYDGNPVTTGMEAMGALLTELVIDMDGNMTTINLNSDAQNLGSSDFQRMIQDMLTRQHVLDVRARSTDLSRDVMLAECQHGISPRAWVNWNMAARRKKVYNDWDGSVASGNAVVPTGDTITVRGKTYEKVTRPSEDSQTPAYLSASRAVAKGDIFDVWVENARVWIGGITYINQFIPGDPLGTVADSFVVRRDNNGIAIVLDVDADAHRLKLLIGVTHEMIGVVSDYDGIIRPGSVVEIKRLETTAEKEAEGVDEDDADSYKRIVIDRPSGDSLENVLVMRNSLTAKGNRALAHRLKGKFRVRVAKKFSGHTIEYVIGETIGSQKGSFLAAIYYSGVGLVTDTRLLSTTYDEVTTYRLMVELGQTTKQKAYKNTTGETVEQGDVVARGGIARDGRWTATKPTVDSDPKATICVKGADDGDILLVSDEGDLVVNTDGKGIFIGAEVGAEKDSLKATGSRQGLGTISSIRGGKYILKKGKAAGV